MGKVVTLGELMLRLSPEGHERLVQAEFFHAIYGGAEANVAVSLANFGQEVRFVSKLPENETGRAALCSVQKYGVDTSCLLRGGKRIGIYYLEKGASQRPDRVIYDRENSAFALSEENEYDWDKIFSGADWFHITGITPALGENCFRISERAVKEAKSRGVTVSFDVNYRKSLWDTDRAKTAMEKLLPYADICIANETQASELFGLPADEKGDKIAETLIKKFDFRLVALTYRRTVNVNRNNIWAVLCDGKNFVCSKKYEMDMVDRVGGGDAFAAGLIYAQMHGFDLQKSADFAEAASCLKHSVVGDFNLVTVEEVEQLAWGDSSYRVSR